MVVHVYACAGPGPYQSANESIQAAYCYDYKMQVFKDQTLQACSAAQVTHVLSRDGTRICTHVVLWHKTCMQRRVQAS